MKYRKRQYPYSSIVCVSQWGTGVGLPNRLSDYSYKCRCAADRRWFPCVLETVMLTAISVHMSTTLATFGRPTNRVVPQEGRATTRATSRRKLNSCSTQAGGGHEWCLRYLTRISQFVSVVFKFAPPLRFTLGHVFAACFST